VWKGKKMSGTAKKPVIAKMNFKIRDMARVSWFITSIRLEISPDISVRFVGRRSREKI